MDEVSLETSNKHSSPGSPGGPSPELALGGGMANGQVMSGYTPCPPAPARPVLEEEHSHWLLQHSSSCSGPSSILPRLVPSSLTAGRGWKRLFCCISFVLRPKGLLPDAGQACQQQTLSRSQEISPRCQGGQRGVRPTPWLLPELLPTTSVLCTRNLGKPHAQCDGVLKNEADSL